MKTAIVVAATIFGIAGGYVPFLWGDDDFFGGWSILFSVIGGLFGIWVGYLAYKRWLS
jgi:hypothetical protein